MKNNFIKSPINYTGNKFRILPQIMPHFNKNIKVFVDLFCGGATVGFNVEAEKIILIDNNKHIINLLETLAKEDIDKIINEIEKNISKYNLSYSYKYGYKHYKEYVLGNNGLKEYNKEGFYKLREEYNLLKNKSTFKANIMLYTLMVYAFNNDIRFSNEDKFNLPVGKTDFNKNNYQKLIEYNKRAKSINYEYVCGDFKSQKIKNIVLGADYVYCDPTYLITTAVYNENHGWSEENEIELLNLLKQVDDNKGKFALSNVLKKVGKENTLLMNWLRENNYKKHEINYHYRSASYNKKNRDSREEEVLITNED